MGGRGQPPATLGIYEGIPLTERGHQYGGIVGRCTTMTGVESIHNVTVTVCVEALKDAWDVVLRDANRMLASVARSI